MKSFDEKYPYIAAWVQDGTVEIGYNDYDDVFLRVTDAGGVVWESNKTYSNLDDAFSEMNAGLKLGVLKMASISSCNEKTFP